MNSLIKLCMCCTQAREKVASHTTANEAAIKAARVAAKESKASAAAAEERLTAASEKAAEVEQQLFDLQVSRRGVDRKLWGACWGFGVPMASTLMSKRLCLY